MFLVVGAGLTGCTIAQQLKENNKEVIIIEKMPHIGGLCYETNGIHHLGPHIFHTNNKIVWEYLSRFTEWNPYTHYAKTEINGELLPLPANLETLTNLFGDSFTYDDFSKLPKQLFELLYKGYSIKQWGEWFSELDSSVFNRIPIRLNNDARYFTDIFQALPAQGYTKMMENMLKGIEIKLNTDYLNYKWEHIFWTGTIDSYYHYEYGKLPYRSLRFEEDLINTLKTADLKSPSLDVKYTRSIDYRYITGAKILIREYPTSSGIEMYPVLVPQAKEKLLRYQQWTNKNVTFCGRLGKYRYFNMDEAVFDALKTIQNYIY